MTSLQPLAGDALNQVTSGVHLSQPLANQCHTHNQNNKYLLAVCTNWQAGDWCGCKRVGWMDGTDQPDGVRKQSSCYIWHSWYPIKQGIDITQQSRPWEPPLDHQPRYVTHTRFSFHHKPMKEKNTHTSHTKEMVAPNFVFIFRQSHSKHSGGSSQESSALMSGTWSSFCAGLGLRWPLWGENSKTL